MKELAKSIDTKKKTSALYGGTIILSFIGILAGLLLTGLLVTFIGPYVLLLVMVIELSLISNFGLWRIKTELIRTPGIQKIKIKKRIITEKKIGKQGNNYPIL